MTSFLNALGVVCAAGNSKESVLQTLVNSPDHQLTSDSSLLVSGEPVYVGSVNEQMPSLADFEPVYQTRNNQLALHAFNQIQQEFVELTENTCPTRVAVVIGTSTSGIREGEVASKQRVQGHDDNGFKYDQQEMCAPAHFVAKITGAKGAVYSVSTACSSSGKALKSAKLLLESDLADIVICGGVDSLCRLTLNGFNALESISGNICKPFNADRDGINIGEAAALFIMSKKSGKIALLSAAESSDAHHISAPHPAGEGAIRSMSEAIAQAGVAKEAIDYINLHGTGTVKNDEMESLAVATLFGDRVHSSSTKHLSGHTLGAAGALEAGFCWLLMQNDEVKLPKNRHLGKKDKQIANVNLVESDVHSSVNVCLSNSFAFGGNNISLVLARHK